MVCKHLDLSNSLSILVWIDGDPQLRSMCYLYDRSWWLWFWHLYFKFMCAVYRSRRHDWSNLYALWLRSRKLNVRIDLMCVIWWKSCLIVSLTTLYTSMRPGCPSWRREMGKKIRYWRLGSMGKGGCLHKKEFPFLFGWTGQYNVYELWTLTSIYQKKEFSLT